MCVAFLGVCEAARLFSKRDAPHHENNNHHAKHWGYRNEDKSLLPQDWHKSHAKCYGQKQSPINVESKETTFSSALGQIDYNKNTHEGSEKWTLKNNGHSVVLAPVNASFGFVMVPDNSEYKLLQMHFHWRGSEHYIDGHKFAAELHLVHQNVENPNKFAVLGFLFSLSNKDNENLKPITENLKSVFLYDKETEINTLNLRDLIPFTVKDYYRYSGSLTTPACDEIVEWFVIDNPVLEISEDQLLDFQTVEDKNGYPILTNVRPIQDINERNVKRSFNSLKSTNQIRKHFKSASGHTESSANKIANSLFLLSLNSIIFCLFF